MTKIYSPNKDYSGVIAGIKFVKGEAETDDEKLLWWFSEKGYAIERKKEALPFEKDEPLLFEPETKVKIINEMTVKELKEIAKEQEIEGYSSMKKAELIKAIVGD